MLTFLSYVCSCVCVFRVCRVCGVRWEQTACYESKTKLFVSSEVPIFQIFSDDSDSDSEGEGGKKKGEISDHQRSVMDDLVRFFTLRLLSFSRSAYCPRLRPYLPPCSHPLSVLLSLSYMCVSC